MAAAMSARLGAPVAWKPRCGPWSELGAEDCGSYKLIGAADEMVIRATPPQVHQGQTADPHLTVGVRNISVAAKTKARHPSGGCDLAS